VKDGQDLDWKDLRFDTLRSGPANAPQISVRVTHTPTGLVAGSDVLSSQLRAREQAMERLIIKHEAAQ
jgi:protein subunit release factor A